MTDLTELAEVEPQTMECYERADLRFALAVALETIDEWRWNDDPHGYCHVRPMLMRLVKTIADSGVPLPATAYRSASV